MKKADRTARANARKLEIEQMLLEQVLTSKEIAKKTGVSQTMTTMDIKDIKDFSPRVWVIKVGDGYKAVLKV